MTLCLPWGLAWSLPLGAAPGEMSLPLTLNGFGMLLHRRRSLASHLCDDGVMACLSLITPPLPPMLPATTATRPFASVCSARTCARRPPRDVAASASAPAVAISLSRIRLASGLSMSGPIFLVGATLARSRPRLRFFPIHLRLLPPLPPSRRVLVLGSRNVLVFLHANRVVYRPALSLSNGTPARTLSRWMGSGR